MTIKPTYWRGYIDGQNKKDSNGRIVTAERAKKLVKLAEMLGVEIEDHRGSLFKLSIPEKNFNKRFPQVYDADYLRGWFDAKGQVYKDPLKLTICGEGIEVFRQKLQKQLEVRLPKVQKPSVTSSVMRMTLTGEKARLALKFLRP